MIQRYLGNKNSILEPILNEIQKVCKPGDWVCDIFSGTLSVSMALKRNGFKVISNDINKFSYSFGIGYLKNNSIPRFDLKTLKINEVKYNLGVGDTLLNLKDKEGFKFLGHKKLYTDFNKLAIVINYLNHISISEIKKKYRSSYFFDSYTSEGKNSYYESSRGTKGKRQFFIPDNGRRIDLILNKILEWKDEELLNEIQYSLLVSILTEAIEKISNNQGTFHDFPRNEYDSRSLKKLFLKLPPLDDTISTKQKHIVGKQRDSLEFIKEVGPHKLIYLDPPYNFRQYTSYYFMLNLVCDYCDMVSRKDYFENIKYVRGQNISEDFKSTFCQTSQFIPSLEALVKDAKTEFVLMSYFNGRNHVNNNIPIKDENGIEKISEFFKSEIFIQNSYRIKPIKRLNYQSFNGHKAQELNEYLFMAKKKK